MPFPLDSLAFIVITGYLIGSLPCYVRLRPGPPLLGLEALEGLVAALLARSISGSGMGMALASLAVVIGQHWPLLVRAKRPPFHYLNVGRSQLKVERTLVTLTGPLLLVAPPVVLWSAVLWSLAFFLTRSASVATALPAVALAPLLWQYTRYDLWGIFGLLVASIIFYQQVPYLERFSRGREPSLRVRRRAFMPTPPRFLRRRADVRRVSMLARWVVVVGFAALVAPLLLNRVVYRGVFPQEEVLRRGNPAFRYIAITFDDGPDPRYTGRILDILKENQAPATFFMVGRHVRAYPALARRIVDEGHEVGNHTDTHGNLFLVPRARVAAEIDGAEASISEATGRRPELFRPPRGLYDRNLTSLLDQRAYTLALWSLSSRDWAELSPGEITRNVVYRVRGGDILLFHDSGAIVSSQGGDRDNTVRALTGILQALRARGFRFTTVSQLRSLTTQFANDNKTVPTGVRAAERRSMAWFYRLGTLAQSARNFSMP